MSICKAQFTWTAPMRQRNECPANRYVFTSRLNCSESTAGSRKTQNGADSTYSEEIGEKSVYFSRYGLVAAQRRIWMASRVAAECRLPLIQTLLISGRLSICLLRRFYALLGLHRSALVFRVTSSIRPIPPARHATPPSRKVEIYGCSRKWKCF